MSDHRLTVLEQQFQVLSQEINEVLGGMQKSMQLLMQGNVAAFQAMQHQIDSLIELQASKKPDGPVSGEPDREGRDL